MQKELYPGVVIIPERIIYNLISESPDMLIVYIMKQASINLTILEDKGWDNGRICEAIHNLKESGFIESNEKTLSV